MLLSSIMGTVVGLIVIVVQRKGLRHAIPYGPFLAIGALTYLFWGDYLGLRIYSH
jgi:leader peptidase (prepilin peptidase)/N-methyltransferase